MKRALLIDLDGTLADSLQVLRRCYDRCAAIHGRSPSDAEFDAINGPPLPEIARRLSRRWALDAGALEVLQTYNALIDQAYRYVDPADGASELLALAHSRGWTTGVVTSNTRARTRSWLARVALADLVEIVVTPEDVRAGKPAPDSYRFALTVAGAEASASLAIEDSIQGVAAARGAQLPTLAIDPHACGRWPDEVRAIRSLAEVADFLAA